MAVLETGAAAFFWKQFPVAFETGLAYNRLSNEKFINWVLTFLK